MDGCHELASPTEKRCDFLLFAQVRSRKGHWTVPIELKAGTIKEEDLDGIREQLQTGADVASDLLPDDEVRMRPVLGHGGLHQYLERKLTTLEYRVRLRGRREVIRAIPCRGRIETVLK